MPNDFDLYNTTMAGRWVEEWQRLQQEERVVHSDLYGGYYVLTRYEDVCAAARDDQTFSSFHDVHGVSNGEQGIVIANNPMFNGFIELDPPLSQRYRRLVAPYFSPAGTRELHGEIRAITTAALDRVIEGGRVDIVEDFAKPITTAATLLLMGMEVDDWRTYCDAFHRMVYLERTAPEYGEVLGQHAWILEQLSKAVSDRRSEPRPDVISDMCRAELSPGVKLTDQDIVDTLYLFLGGGLNTTMSLVSHTLMWLDHDHPLRDRLIADRSLLPAACEEFLRYCTPTQGLARTVTKDCQFAETQFHQGDRVLLAWASANVDAEVFECPGEMRLDRKGSSHTAWGVGSHKCIGAGLARLEFSTMLDEVLSRIPDFEVIREEVVPFPRVGLTNGFVNIPAVFTPGEPSGRASQSAERMWPEPT